MGAQLTIERVSGERSVLDHDLIALPLRRCARHDVTEGHEDAVAAPLYLLNLMLEGDRKAELVGSLLPDHPLGVGQLLGELRVDRDERDMPAFARGELGELRRGMPARAVVDDDHELWPFCHDLAGLDIGVEMYGNTEPLQLLPPPVHDTNEVLAPARAGGDQHLPAQLAGRLEEHNLM